MGCLASCTRVQVCAARDALRYHAVGMLIVRGLTGLGCRWSGRHRRHLPSGSEWDSCTDGALRRHHGLWDVLRLSHGCRSVPLGTLCGTMRWVCWLFVVRPGWIAGGRDAFGDTVRLGRCAPGGVLGTSRYEVLHLLAGSIR